MGIFSPRVASIIGTGFILAYTISLLSIGSNVGSEFHFIFMLLIGGFIGIAAFNFAANEIKETEGVNYVIDLSLGKLVAIFLFAFFIGMGYNALTLIIVEIFITQAGSGVNTIQFSGSIMLLIIGFLMIFPFFQFYILARPGEDSSIPAEFPLESVMEKIADFVKSSFLAAVLAYSILYVFPILVMAQFIGSIETSILLWALLLPLISLGALTGVGLGEDLIRLRLVRNPKDLPKLGLPSINIRKLKFDVGGLLLVILAIQALIFTVIYAVQGLQVFFNIRDNDGSSLIGIIGIIGYLIITLFNKGRGAFKELKEVWTESGFKVSVFQLFLPVFVFLGVILSSSLEVFIQQAGNFVDSDANSSVLLELGLGPHIRLSALFLIIQNIILLFSAIYVFRKTPGTAERRLMKEVPDFYGEDLSGYRYIYDKLEDEQSIENLLKELTKKIGDDPEEIAFLKALLKESEHIKAPNVQSVIGEAIYVIAKKEEKFDEETYEMAKQTLNSEAIGAQLFGLRTIRYLLKYLEGIEKEEALTYIQSYITHPDPVVSWDTSLLLFRVLRDDSQYRSFVLAKMIKTLQETDREASIESITRFFRKIAEENTEIGQMATSTLAVKLLSDDVKNPDALITGIKALLRGNPRLAEDLIDQIAVSIDHPDEEYRRNSYLVLSNMAQYNTGKEIDILNLILRGIEDDSDRIQEIAYNALTEEVENAPELVVQIFEVLNRRFRDLEGVPLIGALNTIQKIVNTTRAFDEAILMLIIGAANSTNPEVRSHVLDIFGDISIQNPDLSEDMYRIAEANLNHDSEIVREAAVSTLGKVVVGNQQYSRSVYREISKSRDDESYKVQLAAIEALGYVASSSQQLANEIFESLVPLLDDKDWQVRLAALNGVYAAAKVQKTLTRELVEVIKSTMKDPDRTIRSRTIDITNWLVENYRSAGEELLNQIGKDIGKGPDEEFTTMVNLMSIIAEYNLLLIPDILRNLEEAYEKEDNNLRFAANETLTSCLEKLESTRSIHSDVHKALNDLVSDLMKAANNSSTKIRRSSYIALTEIPSTLPELKAADRCRNALAKSVKLEKDVALIEYLEEANIRAKKPLEFEYGEKHR